MIFGVHFKGRKEKSGQKGEHPGKMKWRGGKEQPQEGESYKPLKEGPSKEKSSS